MDIPTTIPARAKQGWILSIPCHQKAQSVIALPDGVSVNPNGYFVVDVGEGHPSDFNGDLLPVSCKRGDIVYTLPDMHGEPGFQHGSHTYVLLRHRAVFMGIPSEEELPEAEIPSVDDFELATHGDLDGTDLMVPSHLA